MAVPVVEGAKEKLAGAWAYLRSLPPHVWLGLAIGVAALILAYIGWKNRNNSLSPLSPLSSVTAGSDPTSTLSPVADYSSSVPQNPQASYYNYQSAQTVTPDTTNPLVGALPRFNTRIGYDIHQQSLVNAAAAAYANSVARPVNRDMDKSLALPPFLVPSAPTTGIPGAVRGDTRAELAASTAWTRVVPTYTPPANIKATGRHLDAGIY